MAGRLAKFLGSPSRHRTFTWQAQEERSSLPLPFQDWVDLNFNGIHYPFMGSQTLRQDREKISGDFDGLVGGAFKSNGIVAACMLVRLAHFTEARFVYQRLRNGRPGDLFSNPNLDLLQVPWPNGTTGDLLGRMIQDVDLAGNSFIVRLDGRLGRLHPPWTTIALRSRSGREDWKPGDPDTEVAGYIYKPGGPASDSELRVYPTEFVAHFAPIPDPQATYRGMSWLTPVIREVMGDQAMTTHKLGYFENGATASTVVKLDVAKLSDFQEAVQKFREGHRGVRNAYEPVFLGAGADLQVVGNDMRELDYKVVQAAGETRIAAAAGTPPVIVGLSEGLQGSSLNTGNYAAARRRFSDGTMRWLWRQAAGALASIIPVPSDARLWYDVRDVAFLQEDVKDQAEVQQMQAAAISSLTDAGYDATSVVDAVTSNDFTRLVHSGLFSVQLQPAGMNGASNGNTPANLPAQSPQ